MKNITKEIKWIVDNWDKIPDKFKVQINAGSYSGAMSNLPGLPSEEHFVVLLLDRQKHSVGRSWDFDEERIAVNKAGKVIWGFDSGCSCPAPWVDSYPDCYTVTKSWKEFAVNIEKFDRDVLEECLQKIEEIKKETNV